jgi:hypothetical protein
MFDQQQNWADKPCYYVTAIDGITRIALCLLPQTLPSAIPILMAHRLNRRPGFSGLRLSPTVADTRR